MRFVGIVCMAKNRIIGKGNVLPWSKGESDLKFFREKTTGGNVIMGRKTWESIGVPYLRNRVLWVLTKSNFGWIQLFDDKIGAQTNIVPELGQLPNLDLYWVAGGASVYEALMPKIDEFYVTTLKKEYEGDVAMPEFEHKFLKNEVLQNSANYMIQRFFN